MNEEKFSRYVMLRDYNIELEQQLAAVTAERDELKEKCVSLETLYNNLLVDMAVMKKEQRPAWDVTAKHESRTRGGKDVKLVIDTHKLGLHLESEWNIRYFAHEAVGVTCRNNGVWEPGGKHSECDLIPVEAKPAEPAEAKNDVVAECEKHIALLNTHFPINDEYVKTVLLLLLKQLAKGA